MSKNYRDITKSISASLATLRTAVGVSMREYRANLIEYLLILI